jgi:hypothetical protein
MILMLVIRLAFYRPVHGVNRLDPQGPAVGAAAGSDTESGPATNIISQFRSDDQHGFIGRYREPTRMASSTRSNCFSSTGLASTKRHSPAKSADRSAL